MNDFERELREIRQRQLDEAQVKADLFRVVQEEAKAKERDKKHLEDLAFEEVDGLLVPMLQALGATTLGRTFSPEEISVLSLSRQNWPRWVLMNSPFMYTVSGYYSRIVGGIGIPTHFEGQHLDFTFDSKGGEPDSKIKELLYKGGVHVFQVNVLMGSGMYNHKTVKLYSPFTHTVLQTMVKVAATYGPVDTRKNGYG